VKIKHYFEVMKGGNFITTASLWPSCILTKHVS